MTSQRTKKEIKDHWAFFHLFSLRERTFDLRDFLWQNMLELETLFPNSGTAYNRSVLKCVSEPL